jgi:hypothetical protein
MNERKMRYFLSVINDDPASSVFTPFISICDPNGYENLPMAQMLAIEVSKGCPGQNFVVEQRYEDETIYAELFQNGMKNSR